MQLQPDPFKQRFNCPISTNQLNEPVYCLGDGHTYSKDEITLWLRHNPYKSFALIGRMQVNDLIVNKLALSILPKIPTAHSLQDLGIVYQEPMICLENGQTYEKKKIIYHFQKLMTSQQEKGFYKCILQLPEHSGEDPNRVITQITLYPNLLFYPAQAAIPEQKPFILRPPSNYIDNNPFYQAPFPPAIKNNTIRDLFSQLNALEGRHPCCNPKGLEIIEKIHTASKRHNIKLGPNRRDGYDGRRGPNLSRLDLSGLVLGNIHILDSVVVAADFSRCTFNTAQIYSTSFIGCNFEGTKFVGCNWGGSDTTANFYMQCNFNNASFQGGLWSFSNGENQAAIPSNSSNFKRALAAEGALNTITIRFIEPES